MQQLAPIVRPESPLSDKSMRESIVYGSGRLRIASAVGSRVESRRSREVGIGTALKELHDRRRKRALRLVDSSFVLDKTRLSKRANSMWRGRPFWDGETSAEL